MLRDLDEGKVRIGLQSLFRLLVTLIRNHLSQYLSSIVRKAVLKHRSTRCYTLNYWCIRAPTLRRLVFDACRSGRSHGLFPKREHQRNEALNMPIKLLSACCIVPLHRSRHRTEYRNRKHRPVRVAAIRGIEQGKPNEES